MFTRIRQKTPQFSGGQRDCTIVSGPLSGGAGSCMANLMSDAGFVRGSARMAYGFLHHQVLTLLAPWYCLQRRHAIVETAREIADASPCGPNRAIDLQPTGIGRS